MDYSLLVGIHDPSIPPEEDSSRGSNADDVSGAGNVGGEGGEDGDKDGEKSEDENSDNNEEVPSPPLSPSARGKIYLHASFCLDLGGLKAVAISGDLTSSVEVLESPESPNGSSDDQQPQYPQPCSKASLDEEEVQPLKSPSKCSVAMVGYEWVPMHPGGGATVSFALPLERTDKHELRSTPSERMFPVIGNSVDVFAIPSDKGERFNIG